MKASKLGLWLTGAVGCAVAFTLMMRNGPTSETPVGLADQIVVKKSAHTLTLYRQGQPLRTYQVAWAEAG